MWLLHLRLLCLQVQDKSKPPNFDNSRLFKKLLNFISVDEAFFKDAPFYLTLAYRVFKLLIIISVLY